MCKGVWRKDIDASMLAILHKFESAAFKFKKSNPDFKFTLIVVMGKPQDVDDDKNDKSGATTSEDASHDSGDVGILSRTVERSEPYHIHTNFQLVQKLIKILRDNYPERLSKALIIPNGGWEKFLGIHGLRRYIPSDRTRNKIIILDGLKDILQYASKDQLSTLVGGNMSVPKE